MALKLPQVLRLDPTTELSFAGPHTEIISSKLKLENPSERIVYFKVKTTAPKHYCVRPNSGVIKPRGIAEINVHLQPVESPTVLEKEGAKHKFMIQSAFSDDDNIPSDEFWKSVSPNNVMDSKLRVSFNLTSPNNQIAGIGGAPREPARPAHVTPAQAPAPTPVKPSKPVEPEPSSGFNEPIPQQQKAAPSNQLTDKERKEYLDQIARLTRLNNSQNAEIGVPMIQVILIVFAALLIGLILGKMF